MVREDSEYDISGIEVSAARVRKSTTRAGGLGAAASVAAFDLVNCDLQVAYLAEYQVDAFYVVSHGQWETEGAVVSVVTEVPEYAEELPDLWLKFFLAQAHAANRDTPVAARSSIEVMSEPVPTEFHCPGQPAGGAVVSASRDKRYTVARGNIANWIVSVVARDLDIDRYEFAFIKISME